MSSRQSGGNFKGSKHQRSKPKKLETPKQDGGWLDWLVPPLAIARIARQKKAKRRREMRRRREMMSRREMTSQGRHGRNYYNQNYVPKPRTSRNFYINVSNNSSRNNSKQQNNSQQLKPATNPNRPWVDRRQKG
jgi:hypothetical protein